VWVRPPPRALSKNINMESKYLFKRTSSAQNIVYIGFVVVTLIFICAWIWMRRVGPDLAVIANIIMPILILFGIVGTLLQIFVISKRYFVKLTDTTMYVYRGMIPNTFTYNEIKGISFSGEMLKGIDTGSFAPWPIFYNIENSTKFVQDLSQRYKNNTGKDLTIN
jgi:hypothetical protein